MSPLQDTHLWEKCGTTKRGRGVDLIYWSALRLTHFYREIDKTFGDLDVKSTITYKPLRIIVIYRPPVSATRPFSDELSSYLSKVTVTPDDLVIARDSNLHYEQTDATGVNGFKELPAENNPQKHASCNNTLDSVISRISQTNLSFMKVYPSSISETNTLSSSMWERSFIHPHSSRAQKSKISVVLVSQLIHPRAWVPLTTLRTVTVCLIIMNRQSRLLYWMCPDGDPNLGVPRVWAWYGEHIHNARQLRHANERRWRKTGSAQIVLCEALITGVLHYSQAWTWLPRGSPVLLGEKGFTVVNKLLSDQDRKLPGTSIIQEPCHRFVSFFQNKITLEPATEEEPNMKVVRQCMTKMCYLDLCPPDLLKKTLDAYIPYPAAVVSDRFRRGLFPKTHKISPRRPLLRKVGLDTSVLVNYRLDPSVLANHRLDTSVLETGGMCQGAAPVGHSSLSETQWWQNCDDHVHVRNTIWITTGNVPSVLAIVPSHLHEMCAAWECK